MLLTIWLGGTSSWSNVRSQPKQAKYDLDVWTDLPCFLQMWRGKGFPVRGPLFDFLVTTVNQGCTSQISVLSFTEFEAKRNAESIVPAIGCHKV